MREISMNEKNYTLQLEPHSSARKNVGPYDLKNRTPKYEIDCIYPTPESKYQVEIGNVLSGSEDSCLWIWEIENRSKFKIFVKMFKDGQLITK
jgi:hypothetical protein